MERGLLVVLQLLFLRQACFMPGSCLQLLHKGRELLTLALCQNPSRLPGLLRGGPLPTMGENGDALHYSFNTNSLHRSLHLRRLAFPRPSPEPWRRATHL